MSTNDIAAALLSLAIGLPLVAAAQSSDRAFSARTSDGQPDLQGYWTNNTVVPFERPAELGEKAFYTEEEAAELLERRLTPQETEAGTDADVHYQLSDFALDHSYNGVVPNLRTSIIVDPPNGRLPPPVPAALEQAKQRTEHRRVHGFDSAKERPLGERCIMWPHQGPPIIPVGYNSNLQILQSPGYVVIVTEMLPDPRIVPLDGRPHLPAGFGQWLGNSRGHWDGDTLVVETTNFSGNTPTRGVPGLMTSKNARVIERFTRLDENTIRYEFTVDDPDTWTRPWSGEYPMGKIDGPMFEYACHEGNYGIANTLSGARTEERERAAAEVSDQRANKR